MPKAYLGLGGNVGNRKSNINEAIRLLESHSEIRVCKRSADYETAPVGYEQQEWFLNVVVEIETTLPPYELLTLCNDVEQQLKRVRLIRWGPRTIDIDILIYEGFESKEDRLIVPHPRMTERAFVIIPLMEIAPNLHINGRDIKEIAKDLYNQKIRKLEYD
ncbi:MAG: 2-amino-4-hydroxy-6-hydroxymethyldihydropteridine diphosphokinase [Lutisporaceae bacterium]